MLKIRLRRMGARHSPFYRVVVSDSRNVPTASAVEELGHYDPTSNPARVVLDAVRVSHWVAKGAQMSPTVKKLVANARPASAPAVAAEPAAKPARASRKGGAAKHPAAAAAEGNA
jgi:small subunit ribosomal protein S16